MSGLELVFKCPTCGSTEARKEGKHLRCKFCGNLYREDIAKSPIYADLRIAFNKRQEANFDDARRTYDRLIKENPGDSLIEEVYWGRFLCEQYVIFYQNDSEESIPSFWEINPEHYSKSKSYLKAMEYGEKSGNSENYERLAKCIEEYKKKYQKVKEEYPDGYQIFICFKDSGTTDRNMGYEIYNEFSGKYKIFFSPKSLNEISGNDYEPYIYHALKTAKVMLVICSSREALESKWVHNEWWRFHKFAKGTERTIIPIFRKGFEEVNLPQEIKHCQGHYEGIKLVSDLSERLSYILQNDSKIVLTSFEKEINEIEREWLDGNKDDAVIEINNLISKNTSKPHNHVSALLMKAKFKSDNYSDIKNRDAKTLWKKAEEIAQEHSVPIKNMKEYKAYRSRVAAKRAKHIVVAAFIAIAIAAGAIGAWLAIQDPTVDMYVTGRPATIDVEYGSNHIAALPTITVVTKKGNKTEIEINDSMVSGFDPTKMGPQTVTVTYDGTSIEVTINVVKYSLSAPTGLTVENGKLVWDEIHLAESYTLMVNDTVINNVQSNFYEEDIFTTPGIYSVKVKVNADAAVGKDSGYSNVISVVKLAHASNPVLDGANISWDAIENCTGYSVYINGEKVATALSNTFKLASDTLVNGANTIYVVPSGIGNVKLLSDATESEKTNYDNNGEFSVYKYAYVSGLAMQDRTLTWTAVPGCTDYAIYINGSKIASSAEASYQIPYNKFATGENKIYVVPVNAPNVSAFAGAEGTDYSRGEELVRYKYDRVSGLTLDGRTIKWNSIIGSTGYAVYLNDTKIAEVTATSYELAESALGTKGNKIYVVPLGSCNLLETASDGNDFANNGVISLDRLSEVTGLAYADGRISWNSVAGADKYEIYLNGSLVDSVYDTYYVLVDASKTPARTDVYTVRACADGAMSSAMSTESVSIRYLAAANNVSINGTVLSWNAVDGAEGYAVYANGKIVETVDATKLSFNLLGTLEKGDYSIKVVPVGNSESVIAPEVTDTINYTVNETIIYISTEQDLYNVRLDLSAVYILKNDITLTNVWSPIGTTANPFNGKFNGGGYTISGVQISATSGEGTGLFGVIGEDGTVYNVVLADVSCVSGSYGNVAGLAGINRGTVYGVKVYGSVSAKGSDYIGGIVGRNYGSIYDCVNYADVTGRKNVGGISGGSEISDYSTQIYNCENNGSVNGSFRVGGIMGNVQITKKITVYGLTNNGEVVCSGDYCGGIFGNVSGSSGQIGTLNSCVNNANVTGTGYVGGCFGNVGGYITVTLDNVSDTSQNCVNNGTVTATGGNKYGQIYPGA